MFKTNISIVKFSMDSKYLITVSNMNINGEQEINLWDWTSATEGPTCEFCIKKYKVIYTLFIKI